MAFSRVVRISDTWVRGASLSRTPCFSKDEVKYYMTFKRSTNELNSYAVILTLKGKRQIWYPLLSTLRVYVFWQNKCESISQLRKNVNNLA